MARPTIEAWREDEIEPFYEEITGTWRWGNEMFSVFKDEETGDLWGICWRDTTSGDYDCREDLSDGDFFEVKEVTKTVVDYIAK